MHISEGVLSPAVLGGGMALSAAGTALGLKQSDYARLASTAVLASAFFAASLVHVPLGPGNVHLVLNGLLGLFLGWTAFPAILVALLLQAILFRYGGIAVLGVNVFAMAFPAVVCHYAFRPLVSRARPVRLFGAFVCGALSVAGSGFFAALALTLTDIGFQTSARILFLGHIPIMVLEGCVVAATVDFVARTRPELLAFSSKRQQGDLQ